MKNIDIRGVLREKAPALFDNYPKFVGDGLVNFLNVVFHTKEINHVLTAYADKKNFDFIDSLFDYLNFRYDLCEAARERIPAEGKLIVVANHPLGGLDGLAILRAIGEVRRDVKVVANDILLQIENIRDLLLPYDVLSVSAQRRNLERIEKSLTADEAILFFPAAEVSRLGWGGVQDRKWLKGAAKYAAKFGAAVLPIFVNGQNSLPFYLISLLYRRAGMFMLPRELFNKKDSKLGLIVGNPIPAEAFAHSSLNDRAMIKLVKKHVYNLGSGKPEVFRTETNIIHPVAREILRGELSGAELLGETFDYKKIYLCRKSGAPNVIKEISRLREITFRSVGEGTGKSADTDKYDETHDHIVLWDDMNYEVIGSYRLAVARDLFEKYGAEGLYGASMFRFGPEAAPVFERAIELGRSFIQRKYWKSSALDYIWQGIGAYIQKYPGTKYLLGAVSVSDSYSTYAKNLLIFYYRKWYGDESFAVSLNPYAISAKDVSELEKIFIGKSHLEDFLTLKNALKEMGYSVPPLYRKYVDLCEYGGAKFLGFSINPSFMNSIDGLLLLDLDAMRESAKQRYFGQKSFLGPESRN